MLQLGLQIEQGYIQLEIADAAYRYQQAVESGDQVVVGVNQYVAEQEVTDLDRLNSDELAWEAELDRFKNFQKIWRSQGVLPMVRTLLAAFNVSARLLSEPSGERQLTNLLHLAEMIQADWAKVGVKAKIVSFEWGEYLKRSKEGEHQTVLLGWTGDNGDPDNFLNVLLGCDAIGSANRARWCYKPFNDLLIQAKSNSDIKVRTQLYREAQKIFKEQAPWITIGHSVVYEPVRNEVVDYKIDPFGGHIFYGVDLK